MIELPRAIDIVLHPTYADVSVMAPLSNPDDDDASVRPSVSLGGGFLTDLSVRVGEGAWRKALFTDRDAAWRLYEAAFEGRDTGHPRIVGLSWEGTSSTHLEARLRPRESVTIAYKITVPLDTRWSSACRWSFFGFGNTKDELTHVRVADAVGRLRVDRVDSPDGAAAIASDGGHSLEFGCPTTDLLSGDVALLPASQEGAKEEQSLVDAWFDTASRLGEVPEDAHVVVAVDTSRSVLPIERDAILVAARSYVSHFEAHGAEVAIVTFDRRATASPFLSPTAASEALAALVTYPAGNGSNVDAALAEASRLLASRQGPRRVVVFSDLETADRLDPRSLEGVLPAETILHVVRMAANGNTELQRDDESAWAPLSRATAGLAWSGSAKPGGAWVSSVFEELARPVRLDHIHTTPALDAAGTGDIGSIGEGGRFTAALVAPVTSTTAASITLEGELWSTKVSRTITGTSAHRRMAAGRVFTNDALLSRVDSTRLDDLATLTHALSPVTSFVLVDGGGGPVRTGIGGGYGRLSGAHRSKPRVTPRMEYELWSDAEPRRFLDTTVAEIASACGGSQLAVRVETTEREIVDVAVEGAATRIASCIEEATWAVELPAPFEMIAHRTWVVGR